MYAHEKQLTFSRRNSHCRKKASGRAALLFTSLLLYVPSRNRIYLRAYYKSVRARYISHRSQASLGSQLVQTV